MLTNPNHIILICSAIVITAVLSIYLTRRYLNKKVSRVIMKAEHNFTKQATDLKKQLHSRLDILQGIINKLELSNQELNRLNEIKSKFMSIVAHDLKQPLTSIQGFTSVLMDDDENKNESQQMLTSILKASENMNNLMSDLVDISMMESGSLKMDTQPFNYNELVAEVYVLNKIDAEKKGIQFLLQNYPTTISALGDRLRVLQILNNIISNAVKFTTRGGKVEIKYQVEGDFVKTFVSDTGPGIGYEDKDRIFQKFHQSEQAHRKSKKQGWGLGLCIASDIVKAHKGDIGFESAGLGRGTTFWFNLPTKK